MTVAAALAARKARAKRRRPERLTGRATSHPVRDRHRASSVDEDANTAIAAATRAAHRITPCSLQGSARTEVLSERWLASWQSASNAIDAARSTGAFSGREAAARQAALRDEIAATCTSLQALARETTVAVAGLPSASEPASGDGRVAAPSRTRGEPK